ncbi:putative toxin-antitoxin system toxin component, PIN family [Candidatus Gottesmanbacteria bacterium]|nr:putative toxin-antitoxin system toxin component, PIN family [Candidatus Gottesmanbacteria bacterium]
MRVVIDANVIVSFLLTRGETISSIFYAWEKEVFVMLINTEIWKELEEVIERIEVKGVVDHLVSSAFKRHLRKNSIKVPIRSKVDISKDKKDNRYLACVKDGNADYLVTGDSKHLLPIKKFGKTKIISPVQFKEIISEIH